MRRLLDWRLRRLLRKCGLPDLPEVRRYCRLCYWNGFTSFWYPGGALRRREEQARIDAFRAVAEYEADHGSVSPDGE